MHWHPCHFCGCHFLIMTFAHFGTCIVVVVLAAMVFAFCCEWRVCSLGFVFILQS